MLFNIWKSLHSFRVKPPPSFQTTVLAGILLILVPLVYTRSFLRCLVLPDDIEFNSVSFRISSGFAQAPSNVMQNFRAVSANTLALPKIPAHSVEELKRMIQQLPREEVFKKYSPVVLRRNEEMKDIGFSRTRCFSRDGIPKGHICAPSVLVAGYEKCGTSALYFKLSKHPEILAHPYRKELCPLSDTAEGAWDWISDDNMPRINFEKKDNLLLNGCIALQSKPLALMELVRISPGVKVLISLRNFADWSYSYYSYRCVPGYDTGCEKLRSVNQKGSWKDSRNPENFAKIVNSVGDAKNPTPHPAFRIIRPSVLLYRPWLENMIRIIGRESILILRQEDLTLYPHETLSKVAQFIEIDDSKFPPEAISLVSNTNDKPSQMISVQDSSQKEVSSIVNSGSVIWDSTRAILNKFWQDECIWLRDSIGVHFKEAC